MLSAHNLPGSACAPCASGGQCDAGDDPAEQDDDGVGHARAVEKRGGAEGSSGGTERQVLADGTPRTG